jgi:hypothetical protein
MMRTPIPLRVTYQVLLVLPDTPCTVEYQLSVPEDSISKAPSQPGVYAVMAQAVIAVALVASVLVTGSAHAVAAVGLAMLANLVIGALVGRRLSMAPVNLVASAIVPGLFTLVAAATVLANADTPVLVAAGTVMALLAVLLEMIGVSLLVLGHVRRSQRSPGPERCC